MNRNTMIVRLSTKGRIRLRLLFASVVLLFSGWMPSVYAQAPSRALIDLLNHYYTFSAHFQQQWVDAKGHLIRKDLGKLALERPGHFLWQTVWPEKQLLITQGHYLWVYDVDLAQAIHKPLTVKHHYTVAELLSYPPSRVAKHFHISILKHPPYGRWFVLKPTWQSESLREVQLGFVQGVLKHVYLIDPLGQQLRIRFYRTHVNGQLPDGIFSFHPPKNVDVITR